MHCVRLVRLFYVSFSGMSMKWRTGKQTSILKPKYFNILNILHAIYTSKKRIKYCTFDIMHYVTLTVAHCDLKRLTDNDVQC